MCTQILTIVLLFGTFVYANHQIKLNKYKNVALNDDNSSDYKDLLHVSCRPTMEIKRLRFLAVEIFKTLYDLNPSFMKEQVVKCIQTI